MKSTDVIHVLSAGRPRWALQLLKMSAEKTVEQKDTIIKWGYVKQILPKYCQYRINDLVKEHQHQTEDLENIIMSFSKSRSEFDTSGLLDYIGRNISLKKPVKIENETEISSPMQIAHFLYRIGFIEAINVDNLSEHYSYSEYSHLLMSTNHDYTKIKWQIRPSYYSGLLP
jgi:adenylate cyclase class IV